jgi:hypothetical protein
MHLPTRLAHFRQSSPPTTTVAPHALRVPGDATKHGGVNPTAPIINKQLPWRTLSIRGTTPHVRGRKPNNPRHSLAGSLAQPTPLRRLTPTRW